VKGKSRRTVGIILPTKSVFLNFDFRWGLPGCRYPPPSLVRAVLGVIGLCYLWWPIR